MSPEVTASCIPRTFSLLHTLRILNHPNPLAAWLRIAVVDANLAACRGAAGHKRYPRAGSDAGAAAEGAEDLLQGSAGASGGYKRDGDGENKTKAPWTRRALACRQLSSSTAALKCVGLGCALCVCLWSLPCELRPSTRAPPPLPVPPCTGAALQVCGRAAVRAEPHRGILQHAGGHDVQPVATRGGCCRCVAP